MAKKQWSLIYSRPELGSPEHYWYPVDLFPGTINDSTDELSTATYKYRNMCQYEQIYWIDLVKQKDEVDAYTNPKNRTNKKYHLGE